MSVEQTGQLTKFRIDMNNVGGAGASWVPIPLRQKGTISRKMTTEDASTADDDGWEKVAVTGKGWEISIDGLLSSDGAVYQYLLGKWESDDPADNQIWISFDASIAGGVKREGHAVLSKFDEDHSNRKLATISMTFSMQGKPAVAVL